MTGKIDPLFANHPDILAIGEQTQRFIDGLRSGQRPTGSNADEWHLFLSQYLDNRANFPTGLTYMAVQIAEAIEAAPNLSIEEFRAQSKSYLDELHLKENQIAMLMADNLRLRRSEVSIGLMRRVWANLYFNEKEAGGTFQQTLSEVVDWLAARGVLPDRNATSPFSSQGRGGAPSHQRSQGE